MSHRELDNRDTGWSSATRFLIEIVAWVAGPWAAASVTGRGWVAVPALVLLVGVPALFSTPGDKNQVIIATAGPVRVVIEVALLVVAIAAAAMVWPLWAAVLVGILGIAMLGTGRERMQWLLAGAPTSAGTGSR